MLDLEVWCEICKRYPRKDEIHVCQTQFSENLARRPELNSEVINQSRIAMTEPLR